MERKNTIARLAFNAFLVVMFGGLLHACATTEAVLGQDSEKAGYNTAKKLRGDVVHVIGTIGKQRNDGLGFIVGENDKELFIVTANHVVRPMIPKQGQAIPKTAQIEFLHAQGEYQEAQIKPKSNEKLDLAILSVPRPENFEWQKKAIGQSELAPLDKVWVIKNDGAWTVTSESGSVSKSDPTQITTSGLKIMPGYSGTPLISKSGIIGMIYKVDSTGDSFALPLAVIKSQVDEWAMPWNLENNYAGKSKWLWVLLGVGAAALAVSGGGGGGGAADTGTLTVTAPAP